MYGIKNKSINSIIHDFLNKKKEDDLINKKEEELTIEEDGKVVSYPRKKRKLKQKDLFMIKPL